MTKAALDIERIVREVLAEMGGMLGGRAPVKETKPVSAVPTPVPAPSAAMARTPEPSPGDLAIDARVVTMEAVTGKLGGVRRLRVVRGALVTPAVRDELLRRGIALEFGSTAGAPAPAQRRLTLITVGGSFDPAMLMAGLKREGVEVEHVSLDCLMLASDRLAADVASPDTLGLLLTRHTAAAMCLANRLQGVRAVQGCDAPSVATAAAAVGANVLVASPKAGTFFQLKQMVSEFCRAGVRACPDVFQARLA